MFSKKSGILAVAFVVAVAACSSSTPATAVPTAPPASASADATVAPSAEATVAPTAAPPATPAPVTPAPATPAPTPTPASNETVPPAISPVDYSAATGADPCTGSDTNKTYLLATAKQLKFDLYCAVLPKGWVLKTSSFSIGTKGGYFEAIYQYKTKTVKIQEGTVCSIGSACTVDAPIAGAYFGQMSASLYDKGTSLVIGAKFGANPAWALVATGGVTQTELLTFGAALYKLPKA